MTYYSIPNFLSFAILVAVEIAPPIIAFRVHTVAS